MTRWTRRGALSAVALAMSVLSGCEDLLDVTLPSQLTDDAWLEDCQDSERRNDRYVFCDVRVERMRTPSGGLRVDGRQNGGIIVIGEAVAAVAQDRFPVAGKERREVARVALGRGHQGKVAAALLMWQGGDARRR